MNFPTYEPQGANAKPRQIVAIVLSQILNELARQRVEVEQLTSSVRQLPKEPNHATGSNRSAGANHVVESKRAEGRGVSDKPRMKEEPRAVVWVRDEFSLAQELDAKCVLDAVDRVARGFGVCEGQTIAEARALVAHLAISVVNTLQLLGALERVAEAMSRFGTTVAISLPDTVWVEVTGITHLFGGDSELIEEMKSVLEELGHRARIAMSDGPWLARAFAIWETQRCGKVAVVISAERKQACLRALPITSLPLPSEIKVNLAKLGLLSAGDLLDRDAAIVSSRLGDHAHAIASLLRGEDTTPLTAYRPLCLPVETLDWDAPLGGNEPVLFALRRLTTRVAARLRGRALAARSVTLTLKHDPAIARFRGKEASSQYVVQLVSPLARAEDLWRVLAARLAKIRVEVPNVGVSLEVLGVEETKQRQLDLAVGFSKLDAADPERMAVLFSELASDIGTENFGTLRLANTHKPEKMTLLAPVETTVPSSQRSRKQGGHRQRGRTQDGRTRSRAQSADETTSGAQVGLGEWREPERQSDGIELPSRMLPKALVVQTRFRVGELLPLGPKLYTISKVKFQRRLESVEWWSNEPCSRDYLQLWLSSAQGELQVLAYVDRVTQTRYVQGWYD